MNECIEGLWQEFCQNQARELLGILADAYEDLGARCAVEKMKWVANGYAFHLGKEYIGINSGEWVAETGNYLGRIVRSKVSWERVKFAVEWGECPLWAFADQLPPDGTLVGVHYYPARDENEDAYLTEIDSLPELERVVPFRYRTKYGKTVKNREVTIHTVLLASTRAGYVQKRLVKGDYC